MLLDKVKKKQPLSQEKKNILEQKSSLKVASRIFILLNQLQKKLDKKRLTVKTKHLITNTI